MWLKIMEVVYTSNLVSQENEKATAACNFQTMSKFQACNFIKKETLAQVLSCEICEISKSTIFTEHLQMTASTMNSLYIPHDLMRGKIGSYAYMQTRTVKKCPKKYIDIKQQNQNRAAIN